MRWLNLMKICFEVFSLFFIALCAEIKTLFNVFVKTLMSDNNRDCLSETFQSYLIQHGILHQTSYIDTPSQNGVAKRKNKHLLKTTRALLF